MVDKQIRNIHSFVPSASVRKGLRGPAGVPYRRLLTAIIILSLLITGTFALHSSAGTEKRVFVADVEGVIDPAIAEYVGSSIKSAERAGAEALVIRMDTPGGLDTSMRIIIKDILNSDVPVIVYVAPAGARAASAGTFITMASHVAAMAPGTNIGAAHPVSIVGQMPEEVEEKVVNDSVAYIRGIAKKMGRNEDWAESAVRKSVSVTAERALELNVIDHVAQDLETLLNNVDGTTVETASGSVTLSTKGAELVDHPMSFRQRVLHILANPNVAYFLLMLGFYGILYELTSPGLGLSGIGGAVSITLGLYSLQVIPVNYAGLVLIILGIGLLLAEAFSPGFGVLGAGGVIAMTVGSFVLFDSPIPGFRVSPFVILPTVLTTAAFVLFATRMALRARKKKPITGAEAMVGQIGEVKRKLDPKGEVFIRGEFWRAESLEGPIDEGELVETVEMDGLKLKVKRVTDSKMTIEGGD